jgi:hypothetical protein
VLNIAEEATGRGACGVHGNGMAFLSQSSSPSPCTGRAPGGGGGGGEKGVR